MKVSLLKLIKQKSLDLPWLMPGVGFQGGNLEESLLVGEKNNKGLAIINISRGIIFAGDLSESAIKDSAKQFLQQMREYS